MSGYFDGWYFKHQNKEETLAVIVGRAKEEAFLQAITGKGSYRVRYPLHAYHKGRTLQLADSRFARNGIRLAVQEPGLELTGQLYYTDLTPIEGDIMGPFQFLPMQCRHQVLSMNHGLTGTLRLNGSTLDFTGGKGYSEGDAGRSFPRQYLWVQANDFDRDCSIMASIAHIPMGWSWFWGCIAVVWLDGVEYRLATYRGAGIRRMDEQQLQIVQGDFSLQVQFLQTQAGHTLDAPDRGSMARSIREVPCAPACFEFRQGDRVLFRGQSKRASYEHVLD